MSQRTRGVSRLPKRSELSIAMGRAPIVKTSRRMPPTPVAAPWYGSTADGWLWLSILNATAHPSPTLITPAFSPGPCSTYGASVGSVLSTGRECLYEQCSLHNALTMPSSVNVGSRPSSPSSLSYSNGVRPCSATNAGVMAGSPGRGCTAEIVVLMHRPGRAVIRRAAGRPSIQAATRLHAPDAASCQGHCD